MRDRRDYCDSLVSVVAADLRFLREEWDESVDADSVRRTSPVLRRLLVHRDLQRAWKASGLLKQPRVSAIAVEDIVAGLELRTVKFACAAEAASGGIDCSGMILHARALGDDEIRASHLQGSPKRREYLLEHYLNSPCAIADGLPINRVTLIKYVAEKLGGDHFDSRRTAHRSERAYTKLDWSLANLQVAGKPVVLLELLAIGQAVANAPDIGLFIRHVEGRL